MMLFQVALNPTTLFPADFFTFLLPWVFTFVVVYGLLDKIGVFGDLKKEVNLVLSLIFAFFVTAAAGPQMAAFFMGIFGNFIVVAVGILVLILFLQMLGKPLFGEGGLPNELAAISVFVLGVILFFGSGGSIPGLNINSTTATLIFWGAILLMAVWYVQKK